MKTFAIFVCFLSVALVIETTKAGEEKTSDDDKDIEDKIHEETSRVGRSSRFYDSAKFNESPNDWMFNEHQGTSSFLPQPSDINENLMNQQSDFFGSGGDYGRKIESKPVLVNQEATVTEVTNNVPDFDNSRFNGNAPLKPNFYKRNQSPAKSGSSGLSSAASPDLLNLLRGMDLEGIMAGKLHGAAGR